MTYSTTLKKCLGLLLLLSSLSAALNCYAHSSTTYDDDTAITSRYIIENGSLELIYGAPKSVDRTIWNEFTRIIPASAWQGHVSQFSLFDDGVGNTLAYVVQTDDYDDLWELSIDIKDYLVDYKEFVDTLIHETAHIISLNRTQVDYKNHKACQTKLLDEGCLHPDAYLLHFTEAFWTPSLIEEHAKTREDDDLIYEFYERNEDQFVSDYAATNISEDFAESFATFVLRPKIQRARRIKDEKTLFFYDYESLVRLRSDIRNNMLK